MATYTDPEPASGAELISDSQPKITGNFTYLHQCIDKDHKFTSTSNPALADPDGYHKVIHFENQVADPGALAVGQLYTKTAAGAIQLFYENATTVFQLTNNGATAANPGSSSLIGGMLIKFGTIVGAPITNGTAVGFSGNFSSAVYSCVITGQTASTNDKTINILAGSLGLGGFTVICSGSSAFTSLSYIAIGT